MDCERITNIISGLALAVAVALCVSLYLVIRSDAAEVCSKSGHCVRVSPSARSALQCVVTYVEARGVKIKAMRGYGRGTVRGSLHPAGKALDINQTARDVTRPHVPRAISNAAADQCGVTSGARWHDADNGHWNLGKSRPSHEYSARRHRAAPVKRQEAALTW